MIDRSLVEKFLLRLPRFIFPKEKKKKNERVNQCSNQLIIQITSSIILNIKKKKKNSL